MNVELLALAQEALAFIPSLLTPNFSILRLSYERIVSLFDRLGHVRRITSEHISTETHVLFVGPVECSDPDLPVHYT